MTAPRLTAQRFIEAIEGSDGIKSTICKRVPCSAPTLKKWLDEHPTILTAYNTECNKMLGIAQSVVTGNIRAALKSRDEDDTKLVDSTDAKWFLSRKGRHEGFGTEEAQTTVNIGFNLGDWRKHAKDRVKQVEEL